MFIWWKVISSLCEGFIPDKVRTFIRAKTTVNSPKRICYAKIYAAFDNMMRPPGVICLELCFQLLIQMVLRRFSPSSSKPHNQTLLDVRSVFPHQDGEVLVMLWNTWHVPQEQPSPHSWQSLDLWKKIYLTFSCFLRLFGIEEVKENWEELAGSKCDIQVTILATVWT